MSEVFYLNLNVSGISFVSKDLAISTSVHATDVTMKFSNSPISLQIRWSLKPKKHHDKYDFRLRKRPVAVIFALGRGFYGIFFRHTVKKLAEFIRHKENFRNFVPGEHSDYCLYYFCILSTIKVQQFSLITKLIGN